MKAVCLMTVLAALSGCGKSTEGAGRQENESADGEMAAQDGGDTEAGGSVSDGVMLESGVGVGPEGGIWGVGPEEKEDTEGAVKSGSVTFSILGDSISTFRGYNPEGYYVFFPENGDVEKVEDTWWYQAADNLKMALYANASSSGSTVAGDSTGTADPQCGCNEFRISGLSGPEGACPDRIVIFMGTNDLLTGVPLGDNDGNRPVEEGIVENFSDAYTLMLDKVQANYPQAEIYCCTLLPVGDYGTDTPYVAYVNGEQLTYTDYGDMIARIAGNRGLSVIDLSDCGIAVENLQEMTSDGVHPTAAGMKRIAEKMEETFAGPTPQPPAGRADAGEGGGQTEGAAEWE